MSVTEQSATEQSGREPAGIGSTEFLGRLRPVLTESELENVETAYAFSKYAHRGQERASGVRYFEHPKAVAWIIVDELRFIDWSMIAMALLHDVLEDTYLLSRRRMEINFGRDVAVGIQLLSKQKNDAHLEYIDRLRTYGSWQTMVVKMADRLHNLRTLDACEPAKRARKRAETREHYLPIATSLVTQVPREHVESIVKLNIELDSLSRPATSDRI
jgi:GTP diphosphokinase / guanosine-3',5'-bis(diphosphate) 3'-diphosphatase